MGSNDGTLEGVSFLAADIVGNSTATLPLAMRVHLRCNSLHLMGATVSPGPNLDFTDALLANFNLGMGISLCA